MTNIIARLTASRDGLVVLTADVVSQDNYLVRWPETPVPSVRLGTQIIGSARLVLINRSAELPEGAIDVTVTMTDSPDQAIALSGKFYLGDLLDPNEVTLDVIKFTE